MQVTMAKKVEKVFMRIKPEQLQIRLATLSDLPVITEIYNEAVLNGVATFDTEAKSLDDRKIWFNNHGAQHPILVAYFEEALCAWASLNRWSDRSAYDGTAEVSIYVHHEFRDRGVGSILFPALIAEAKKVGLHYLLARITQGNDLSIRLHQRNGFTTIGVMHEVGFKFGKFLDVTLMEQVFNK
jgi:phosphinothricin acetyltransferase